MPEHTMTRDRLNLALLTAAAVGFVFWRAWTADDAFITFRHVENCLAGYGPVFNVGERVQGFTHPLWFLLLLAGSTVMDTYFVAIALSLICTAALVWVMSILLRRETSAALVLQAIVLTLLSSRTFVEYQTSGLEGALTHLLIVGLFGSILFRGDAAARPGKRIALLCALVMLNRPDRAILCGPIIVWILASLPKMTWRRRIAVPATLAIPLLSWYGFAAIYYGTPLPNTAYAKIALPPAAALTKGLFYLRDYVAYEPIHVLLIAAILLTATVVAIGRIRRRDADAAPLACVTLGLWLEAAYVISIGGDFMRGRFWLPLLVGSTVLGGYLLSRFLRGREPNRIATIVVAAGLALACYVQAGLLDLVEFFRPGIRALQDCVIQTPWLFSFSTIIALAALAGAMIYFTKRKNSHGGRVFLGVLLLQLAYFICLVGQRQPPWANAASIAAALGLSALLFGVAAKKRSLSAGSATAILTLLVASICSLWDPIPRYAEAKHVSDEYAWYRGRWDANRFKEPRGQLNGQVWGWVRLGDHLRRYADACGPIAIHRGEIGMLSYHAGPKVTVIDGYGLTDAFIARCIPDPESRIGHTRHDIPPAYLESRGAINRLPDWRSRLEALDPTLAQDAEAMKRSAVWQDEKAHQDWPRVQRIISSSIWSLDRFRSIPAFALGKLTHTKPE